MGSSKQSQHLASFVFIASSSKVVTFPGTSFSEQLWIKLKLEDDDMLCAGCILRGFEKNRFLESSTYNRWKSGLIPLEHHMQNISPVGTAPIWALLRLTKVYTHGQALKSPMVKWVGNWRLTPDGVANCRKRCLEVFSWREERRTEGLGARGSAPSPPPPHHPPAAPPPNVPKLPDVPW